MYKIILSKMKVKTDGRGRIEDAGRYEPAYDDDGVLIMVNAVDEDQWLS